MALCHKRKQAAKNEKVEYTTLHYFFYSFVCFVFIHIFSMSVGKRHVLLKYISVKLCKFFLSIDLRNISRLRIHAKNVKVSGY